MRKTAPCLVDNKLIEFKCHIRVNTPVFICMDEFVWCYAMCFVKLSHFFFLCPAGVPRDEGWRAATCVSWIIPQLLFWQYYPFMEHRRSKHHPQPKRHQQCEFWKLKALKWFADATALIFSCIGVNQLKKID